jgi:hypothetical protein
METVKPAASAGISGRERRNPVVAPAVASSVLVGAGVPRMASTANAKRMGSSIKLKAPVVA